MGLSTSHSQSTAHAHSHPPPCIPSATSTALHLPPPKMKVAPTMLLLSSFVLGALAQIPPIPAGCKAELIKVCPKGSHTIKNQTGCRDCIKENIAVLKAKDCTVRSSLITSLANNAHACVRGFRALALFLFLSPSLILLLWPHAFLPCSRLTQSITASRRNARRRLTFSATK